VTGFGKTNNIHTRIEIHFIAHYNSYTQTLSRHSDTIAMKVCFYRWPFSDPIKPHRTNTDPMEPLGYINRVACGPKLFHSKSALLMVWSGLLWLSVWPTVHTTWSALSTDIIDPPTFPLHTPHPLLPTHLLICSICDIAGCVQNISQNQPVHPVAM